MSARSLNRITLIGNLTRDPELKYTPNGTAVCTFGVATNRSWMTHEGQKKEETQFHRIIAWQKLAELCSKLLTKGRKIYLEGRITYRTFTGKDGQQRSITEIVLNDFMIFGRKTVDSLSSNYSSDATINANKKKPIDKDDKKEEKIEPENSEEVKQKVEKTKDDKKEEKKTESSDKEEKIEPDDIPF